MRLDADRYVRTLGLVLGVALVLATGLALALSLDLIVAPPTFPDSSTLVDRLLGHGTFLRSIWPFDLASNLLFAVAMVAGIPFAWLIGTRVARQDRRAMMVGLFVSGAVLGIVAAVGFVGARQVTIDTAYCDCGFKEQEVISQFWAVSLLLGTRAWLLYGAAILVAIGVAIGGRALSMADDAGETPVMPPKWGVVSYLSAAALGGGALLQIAQVADPAGSLISAAGTGVLLPLWSLWLARDFRLSRGDR